MKPQSSSRKSVIRPGLYTSWSVDLWSVYRSICSIQPSTIIHRQIYASVHVPIHQSIHLSVCQPSSYQWTNPSNFACHPKTLRIIILAASLYPHPFVCSSIHPPICLYFSTYLPIYLRPYRPTHPSVRPSVHPSIHHASIALHIHLSIHLPISACLFILSRKPCCRLFLHLGGPQSYKVPDTQNIEKVFWGSLKN